MFDVLGVTHMVIFRRPEGKPGYHQAESVEDAVRFVEMLRNQEKVTDARIFRMEEVPIEFRTYYRVELAGSAADAGASAQSPPPSPEPADGDAAETAPQDLLDPMPVEVGAARGKRFGRN
jgi:hypothetical protein